jgi:cytochrome c
MHRRLNRLVQAALLLSAGLFAAFPAAAGDPGKGRSVFAAQCSICHSASRGGPTIIGPPLFGVVGRPAGSIKGYAYSAGMKSAGLTWTDSELRTYLPAPRNTVPTTKMTYGGLKNPTQLDDLIAYLDSLK